MDLLSFLPLPNEIIKEIVSYGYCHSLIDNIVTKYGTKNIITKKNKVLNNYIYTTNKIISNQITFLLYSHNLVKKIKVSLLYNENELRRKNYKNNISKNIKFDFPLFTFEQDSFLSYIPKNTKYFSEIN